MQARVRLRELARLRRCFGYRRLHILLPRQGFLLPRQGFSMNHNNKRFRRVYRGERLYVCCLGGRKHARGTRMPSAILAG
jgi:putative transposase